MEEMDWVVGAEAIRLKVSLVEWIVDRLYPWWIVLVVDSVGGR